MNVLVIGGGGREHAIITALAKSKKVDKLYAAPGNGGISKYAECFNVKATDIDGCVELAKKLRPDYGYGGQAQRRGLQDLRTESKCRYS